MANNQKVNVEIPGYYWDNRTSRYYREDSAHPRPPKVFPRVTESNNNSNSKDLPKNLVHMLKNREMGFGKKSLDTFEDFTINKNLKPLKCIKELKPNTLYPANISAPVDVTFLKGGQNSIYLELYSKSSSLYSLKQDMHFFSYSKKFPAFKCFVPSSYSTVDMCEGLKNSSTYNMVIISTDSDKWKMTLLESSVTSERSMIKFRRPYASETPIWCCSKNDFKSIFVFGKRNEILICAFCTNTPFIGRRILGEVRSVQLNKEGNLFYAGVHTGHFEILDARSDASVYRTRLHDRGIDEIVPVFDDKQLICGAFDGMLCNFDLRMRKPINEYFGHVHSPRKVSFSVNEPNDLLCATGLDNVTRIWSLGKGGDPIKYVHPPEVGHACRSWLVSDGCKWLLYQFQKANTYVYDNGNIESLPDSQF